MIGHYGIPGESKFRWERFNRRREAENWVVQLFEEARQEGFPQGIPITGVLTEKEAARCRWRDGRKIYYEEAL